jgi:hypothetical protein
MRILKWLGLGLLLVSGIILIGGSTAWVFRLRLADLYMSKNETSLKEGYLSQSPLPQIQKYFPQMKADAELLSREPFFSTASQGKSDAATFLNPLVAWDDSQRETALRLPEEIAQSLKANSKWMEMQIDWQKHALDFTWFTKLHSFDYWNYDASGPKYLDSVTFPTGSEPLPDYNLLQSWAKLRLLKGRDDKDLSSALKDVRQLARLIMTGDTLVATNVAIAILGSEESMLKYTHENSGQSVQWKLIPLEERKVAKRLFWAAKALLDPRVPEKYAESFLSLKASVCQGMNEALTESLGYRPLLRNVQFAHYAKMDQLLTKTSSSCRSGYTQRVWADSSFMGVFKQGEDIFRTGDKSPSPHSSILKVAAIDEVQKYQHLKSALGYLFNSVARPNAFRLYEEN